jgi:anti-sigma factor RsiW
VSVHTEKGHLMAYLDGELASAERAALDTHLRTCLSCRHALASVQRRASVVSGALMLLDHPAATARAWATVEAALGPETGRDGSSLRGRGWVGGRWALARAAGLVLLLAGGAAAAVVPGSPVRAWLFGDDAPAVATTGADALIAPAAASGSWTRAVDGRVTLDLVAPVGTEVAVVMGGSRAGVQGPADTHYTSLDDGHLRAEASGGPLLVEFPADVRSATLWVNGVEVLRLEGGQVVASPADASGTLAPDREGLHFTVR